MVFFAVWWAWMNFTWFASAYDTDDDVYRITTLVQIAGAFVLAAGVRPAFDRGDYATITAGYVVMRLALVAQWLRAARSDERRRVTALRYAAGITIVQVLWLVRLSLPDSWLIPTFLILVVGDLTTGGDGLTELGAHERDEPYDGSPAATARYAGQSPGNAGR